MPYMHMSIYTCLLIFVYIYTYTWTSMSTYICIYVREHIHVFDVEAAVKQGP